ncbi:MAG: lycopene cyclase domain-containing protein [Saprospiraceae bacterium]
MERFQKFENPISIALIIFLSVIAISNYSKLYTSVTFTSLAIFTVLLKYVFKVDWLHKLYFSYLILMIPFFIVNGLLTGTGLDEPIVWYDNNHNLGIRMLTIPFEDTFYGLLLLMLTVSVYERQSAKLEK